MEIVTAVLEILKYTLPALIVFLTAYFLLNNYMRKEATEKAIEMKMKRDKETVMLRLQAYERLALFLERVNPFGLVTRVRVPDMLGAELQYAMVRSIREEFEHNLSQQIYISSNAWQLIVASKDETIKTINLLGSQLPPDATSAAFINHLFNGIANAKAQLPSEQALEYLKAECRELF
jgi:Fe2+ transport system protein B